MAGSRKLEIIISGDAKGATAAFDKVNKDSSAMGEQMAGIGKKVATGLALGGAAAVALGAQVIDLGAKLSAWRQKTDTVFEGNAGAVRKWADANNEAFGVTDDELAGLAAGFGDLLKPMGFTASQAADMSTKVVGLSGALSAWSGGTKSAAEVSQILAKAMLGERDGLKELGIAISEADVQSRLAAKGQEDLTGAALEQAKALATQELIFEKSTDAQKAWAEGGNEALMASNKLKAGFGEMKEWLSDKLLPAVVSLTSAVASKLLPVFESVGKWISEHKSIVIAVAAAIGTVLVVAFAAWAASAASAAIATLAAMAPLIAIGAALAAVVAAVVYAYQEWDAFRNVVDAVGRFFRDTLLPALQSVVSWIVGTMIPAVANVVAAVATAFTEIPGIISGAISIISGVLSAAWAAITTAVTLAWDAIKAYFQLWWDTTAAIITTSIDIISAVLTTSWDAIKLAVSVAWDAIKLYFETWWTVISTVFTTALAAVTTILSTAWDAITATVTAVWDAIKTVFETVWAVIKEIVDREINGIKTIIETVFNIVKGIIDNVLQGIKAVVETTWTAVKTVTENVLQGLKVTVETVWNAISAAVSTVANAIKTIAATLWTPITNATETVKNTLTSAIGAIVDLFKKLPGQIGSAMSTIAETISRPFTAAFEGIKRVWNATVGGFGFSFGGWDPPGPGSVPGVSFRIPKMHQGGIVPGGRTNEPYVRLQGGEGVFTPDQMSVLGAGMRAASTGGGSVTLVIQGGTFLGTNQESLGRDLVALLNRMSGKGIKLDRRTVAA